ncbi:MATE family efflux transporter [Dictyobacter arantiisoli]|uniref:Multidrug export protein MepA n=1 Tax=Dictyobacter arantiisoli TaxID=2014874 RepID=A0A5A5T841_9CHLR|nr:MATE family efflux transporter [Dictyobacter arantiisoli]GCF07139.1 MATE family efflux transporter [Dictyobacter arantiisoli]
MDQSTKLRDEKVGKLVLQFSLPAIIVLLVSAIYNIIDRVFIGNSVGSLGIAGVTIAFPVMMIMAALSTLVGTGGAALLSIKIGEGKRDEAEQILGNGLTLLILVSIIFTILGLVFVTPILQAYGASKEILPYATDYLQIILLGTIVNLLSTGMNNFIRGEGNPQKAMVTLLIGPLLNVILAPIFIFGFGWGIKGAAWATVLAQLASAAWVLSHFLLGRSHVKFYTKNLRLRASQVGPILALGAAPCGVPLTSSLLNFIINNSLGRYGGDVAISAMGVIVSIQILCTIPLLGISQGIQPIIGFNYGAGQLNRVKDALKYGLLMGFIVSLFFFIITQLIPGQIVAFFDSRDQAMIRFGSYAMRIYLLGLPIIVVQSIGSGFFQAIGKARDALIITYARPLIFFIPLLLILPNFFGLQGVLASSPVTDAITFLTTGTWLIIEVRRLNKRYQEKRAQSEVSVVGATANSDQIIDEADSAQ